MGNFYLKEVTVRGKGKRDSTVNFNTGLNIIAGESDTGKSGIVKTIEYLFGGTDKPFDRDTGYTEAYMSILTGSGEIIVKRKFGKSQIIVDSTDNKITSGEYTTSPTDSSRPLWSDALLEMIGVDRNLFLPKSKDYEPGHVTFNVLKPLWLASEERIDERGSILLPSYGKTLFLSSLLYLLGIRTKEEMPTVERGLKITRAERRAKQNYISEQIQRVVERKHIIENEISKSDIQNNASDELNEIIQQVEKANESIDLAKKQSKSISSDILKNTSKLAELTIARERYESLKSQYLADIKRLSFIIDGDRSAIDISEPLFCPFCNSVLVDDGELENHTIAAQKELERILSQLDGLQNSILDVESEKNIIGDTIQKLQDKQTRIETELKEILLPKLSRLKNMEDRYCLFISSRNELEVLNGFLKLWEQDLQKISEADLDVDGVFKPKELFGEDNAQKLSLTFKEVFSECHYEDLQTIIFDLKKFDVQINGKDKASSHGQGYKSYINSVVLLAFRKYFNENSKHPIGLLVIDTPFLGLDQGSKNKIPNGMQSGLFEYLINHQNQGQTIVIENINNLPNFNFHDENKKINLIEFTENERQGFLYDI